MSADQGMTVASMPAARAVIVAMVSGQDSLAAAGVWASVRGVSRNIHPAVVQVMMVAATGGPRLPPP